MARILVIEDSMAVREAVVEFLRRDGHQVDESGRGDEAIELIERLSPELCVVDVMLPGVDGFQLGNMIAERPDTAFLFLTARDDEGSRIRGFELGADDYVVKPFSPRELVLRVDAILRRREKRRATGERPGAAPTARAVCRRGSGVIRFDGAERTASVDGSPILLTRSEWAILEHLCRTPRRPVGKAELMEDVFGYAPGASSRTIDTHIKNIRAKLGDPGWIRTVRGVGYAIDAAREPSRDE